MQGRTIVEHNNRVRVRRRHPPDQFILLKRQIHRGPVAAFALPFCGQPCKKKHNIGAGGQRFRLRHQISLSRGQKAQMQAPPVARRRPTVLHNQPVTLPGLQINLGLLLREIQRVFYPIVDQQLVIHP